jgi:hypothetical protein
MTFDVERHLGAVERSVQALERDGKPAARRHADANL